MENNSNKTTEDEIHDLFYVLYFVELKINQRVDHQFYLFEYIIECISRSDFIYFAPCSAILSSL
jgi:hypothetical protein